MTLVAATAICRQWLPATNKEHWEPKVCEVKASFIEDNYLKVARCPKCTWTIPLHMPYQSEHDIPIPPATWELAGAMLEILAQRERHVSVEYVRDCGWSLILLSAVVPEFYASPLDAILIASAEWIEGQKQ